MPHPTSSLIGHEEPPTVLGSSVTIGVHGAASTAPSIFSRRATETPDALAVCAGREQLSFKELDLRSNQMANYLQSIGVGPEVAVCVCLKRSLEFVISALGVLKAGGFYVPLDADYPPERLAFCIRDCNSHIVLTQSGILPLSMECGRVVDLNVTDAAIRSLSDHRDISSLSSYSAAYLIYTSGSTGGPKGVSITHANLANLVAWHGRAFTVSSGDRATQMASLGFDAAVWELWPNLCAGAAIYIPDDNTRNSAGLLHDYLVANSITITFVPTPLAEQLIVMPWPMPGSLRLMLTGGDTLHRYPPPSLPYTLVNNYGPTECTVVATSGAVPSLEGVPTPPHIGVPIMNSYAVIVDADLNPVADGECGELLIGGANVGRGYCNRNDLTKERFIPDFTTPTPGARLYRSGDLVRRDRDGTLRFLGRSDEQLKLRGCRIEPNEIVTELNRYPGVRQSAVITRSDSDGDKHLLAYVVPDHEAELSDSSLRRQLGRRLPAFMVPSAFIRIDSLPLTLNQKVDVARLPEPTSANTIADLEHTLREPRSIIEERLTTLVAEVLGLKEVQPRDNFFLLGGHSLLGAELIARIRDTFAIDLSLRQLFGSPTIVELAAEIEQLLLAKVEVTAVQPHSSSAA